MGSTTADNVMVLLCHWVFPAESKHMVFDDQLDVTLKISVTSDGGVFLLSQLDQQLGLTVALDRALADPRRAGRVAHSQLSLLRQRIYGLSLGYEDLSDHQTLRRDAALQTALNRSELLPRYFKELSYAVNYWYPRVAASFGRPATERFELYRKFALRHHSNEELLARWKDAIAGVLSKLELAVPA